MIKFRMNIHCVVFLCFLSAALCGGNTGLVSAKVNIYTGAEGGTGSLSCHLFRFGKRKFFCRDECKEEDILIKTDKSRAQNGRYSIKYRRGTSTRGILTVTITNMTKSDSGQYRCGLGGTFLPWSYYDFQVRVLDAALAGHSDFIHTDTEGETITYPCSRTVYGRWKFLCKDDCEHDEDILIETDGSRAQSGRYSIEYKVGSVFGLYVTITQVTKSDTGWYWCGYGRALSPDSELGFQILVIDAPTTSSPNQTLQPFSALVPSDSTPTATQSFTSSSGGFTPSAVFPEDIDQLKVPCHL
ncbi:polymeric immunoglobulin receptor-like [Epinephelus lanceolatus]